MSALPILLVVASLCVFVLEVFLVSFGVLSVIGVGVGVGGIVLAFHESTAYGWTMIGTLVVGAPLALRFAFKILPKLGFARGLYLPSRPLSDDERHAAAVADRTLVGQVGEAVSPLRPAGTAVFDGRPVQVITDGVMVERGTHVRVVEVRGNRVRVEPVPGAGE